MSGLRKLSNKIIWSKYIVNSPIIQFKLTNKLTQKTIHSHSLRYVRKLETDIMVYTDKYNDLENELKHNPPKLKSKLTEKQKNLSLYKFKIDQAKSRILNADSVKQNALSHPHDDFFSHADFTKYYGQKSSGQEKYCEIETSLGDKYQIDDFYLQLLYDHQIDALHWLLEQHSANRGSLLGDEMGLGKTITSLSLLS